MAAELFSPPSRALDSSGNPYSGAKWFFYATGTTTPQAVYADADLDTSLGATVTADSGGKFASIYFDTSKAYRGLLKNSSGSVTLHDIDPINNALFADLFGPEGSSLIPYLPAGTGAVVRTVQSRLRDTVSVKDFGAVGDDTADDTTKIQAAINFCKLTNRTLYLPPGTYKVTNTLQIQGTNNEAIAIVGDPSATTQQGSFGPSAIIRWRGGASSVFNIEISGCTFANFAVQNFGTATDAFHLPTGQHYRFTDMSFIGPSGSTRFSRAIFYVERGALGYAVISGPVFNGCAPDFIFSDGSTNYANGTPFEICGRGVFESNATFGSTKIVHLKAQDYDSLHIHDCTFNQQANNELRALETDDTPVAVTIANFVFDNNEVDIVSNNVNDRMFAMTNIPCAVIDRNNIQGGSVQNVAKLTNSTVASFNNNYVVSVASWVFDADVASRVYAGVNFLNPGNTMGVVAGTATASGLIPVEFAAICRVQSGYGVGTGHTVFQIVATNNSAFLIALSQPSDSAGKSWRTRGQVFSINLKNTSGGALGAITPDAVFKLTGSAFPSPANGNNRTVTFVFDGTNAVEIYRTAADVPN